MLKTRLLPSLATSALVLGLIANAALAKEVRISYHGAPKHPTVTGGYKPFMKAVEKATNGEITFKLFTGGALLSARAAAEGLRDGVADMATVVPPYHPSEFPSLQPIADMSMFGTTAPAMAAAVSEYALLHCKPCIQEVEARGLVYLGDSSTTGYGLITKTPINSLAQLKGLKIRAGGASFDRWVRFVGGTPVNTTSSEMYDAMSRGQVDAAIHSISALRAFSLADVATDMTLLPLGVYHVMSPFMVGRKFWRSLTDSQRKAFWDAAPLGNIRVAMEFAKQDAKVRKTLEGKGFKFHAPSAELVKNREAFLANELKAVAEVAKTRHKVADADERLALFAKLVDKWTKAFEPMGDDAAAMAALLKSEVFDKVDPNQLGK